MASFLYLIERLLPFQATIINLARRVSRFSARKSEYVRTEREKACGRNVGCSGEVGDVEL